MDEARICKAVEELREDIIAFLEDLVRCETENKPPHGNEKCGQDVFSKMCSSIGLYVYEYNPAQVKGFETCPDALLTTDLHGRNNIAATWRGSGGGRSLLLSGHMDVAPIEPGVWQVTEPFTPLCANGRMYGRGTADMKAGLSAAYMAVKTLRELGFPLRGDVILESVVDEEYASGNGTLAGRLKGYNADFGINMEPTCENIYPTCVGNFLLKLTVTGRAGMPYVGEEVFNPAYVMAKLINQIEQYEGIRNARAIIPSIWDNSVQKSKVILTKVKAGEVQPNGQLSIPLEAWAEIIIQTYPGEEADDVQRDFEAYLRAPKHSDLVLPEWDFSLERIYHYVLPGEVVYDSEGLQTLLGCVNRVCGAPANVAGGPFACDLRLFSKYGNTPAVLFGPTGGALHGPDEWVDLESLIRVTKVLALLIARWSG